MKTNRTLKLITLTAAIFGFAATSFGQTATATATANIIVPIAIENTDNQALAFGNIIANAGGGSVVVTPAATAERTSSDMSFPTVGGTISAAKFTVSGFGESVYSITLPGNNTVSLNGPSGSAPMKIATFTHNATGTLSSGTPGTDIFYVGGTLNVNASQAAGDYEGEFQVTVHYN